MSDLKNIELFENFHPKRIEDRSKDKEAKFFIKKNNDEIDRVIRALREFKDAHDNLNSMWSLLDWPKSEALEKGYPFEHSFDDYNMSRWYALAKEKLESLKK